MQIEGEYHTLSQPLFDFLRDRCSLPEMARYICLEDAVDSRFDDLIALAQIGIRSPLIKLVLARNYWDEMGDGKLEAVHTTMFARSVSYLHNAAAEAGVTVTKSSGAASLQNSNQLMMCGLRREWSPRLLGRAPSDALAFLGSSSLPLTTQSCFAMMWGCALQE
jgi:hypothetical protein